MGGRFLSPTRVVIAVAIASTICLVACGARSTLDGTENQGGAGGGVLTTASSSSPKTSSVTSASKSATSTGTTSSTSTGVECNDASECDDGVDCTIDSCDESVCHNTGDDDACDDGVFCTLDLCNTTSGCSSTFSDSICDDGLACTTDTCDQPSDSCRHAACDSVCDDGSFCDGVERCDTAFGCTAGQPACDLDLACSVDACSEGNQTCTHTGVSSCAPDVHLLTTDSSGALRDVQPYLGTTTTIAPSGANQHLDIAILDGRWFVADPGKLRELVPNTNQTLVTLPGVGSVNSLGAGPDGMLYAADSQVYRINPNTGASVVIGNLPPGHSSSGDIAFLGTRMFVSTDGPCGGALVEVDTTTGMGNVLGGDGLGCVYGLAVKAGVLYIVNCDGKVGVFDPDNGIAQVLSTVNLVPYGADALP